VSECRIEFRTTDGFPCVILAAVDYSKNATGGSNCTKTPSGAGRVQHLLLHTPTNGAHSNGQGQQNLQQGLASLGLQDAAPTAETLDSMPASQLDGSRALLQSTGGSQCPTAKGDVLLLAPFYVENRCANGDESADIAALFQTAGYNVKFRCNDPTVCPGGPPSSDDYTGWSKYSFVAVSTVRDADAAGESPIIVARAPTYFSPERMQDWQAGRMVLTGDGLIALRKADVSRPITLMLKQHLPNISNVSRNSRCGACMILHAYDNVLLLSVVYFHG
jgi:hypothetical protein